ncbi:pyridoxal-phosphate dependent enzyme [Georhizobium profundi]|jgi:cysteine synthase|uniref:Pyridoxal-phosphate dependent enzyme n=1 Tax=Georhizobium profundi TaxID=2341112 RepID=A0A3Q8XQT5_9HYPH|nr:pyridoxal-phosphate dependent enzyme [Georhizobium profundi]AZN71550.1 pyridoxal-phosphate dependent enzyme [Georhizobium profundi]
MTVDADYFRDLETPRLYNLSKSVLAASFPIMKLMPARYILDRAARQRDLRPGGRIVETTSGTFGMAVALLAAARDYRLTLVTASSLIDAKYQHRLQLLGAKVIAVDDPRGDGNQTGRLEAISGLVREDPAVYWTRQYDSDGNWLAYARLAEQLTKAMGQIDWLVGCIGTGGSLCGTGHFLRAIFPGLQIAAVDTHRSVLFGHPVGKRLLRGLGNSVLPANVRHELVDEIHWVGAYPAWQHCHHLLRRYGLFVGPTSGAAGLVGQWIGNAHPGARVAIIMPDEGYRHIDTVFSEAWLDNHPEWTSATLDAPTPISEITAGSEADWTCFPWARRSLEDVMRNDTVHRQTPRSST